LADETQHPGSIAWTDLTVANATEVRDFYRAVVGWTVTEVDMGGYSDFCMNRPADGTTVAGVCHARGENADLPAVWLIYVTVPDLEASVAACLARGGTVVKPSFELGEGRAAIVRDPAGAALALYQV